MLFDLNTVVRSSRMATAIAPLITRKWKGVRALVRPLSLLRLDRSCPRKQAVVLSTARPVYTRTSDFF